MPVVKGSDGLRARDNGEWGATKLAFIDHFAPVALTATRRLSQRHYVDLFAGPGLNRVRNSVEEFEGSPLRIIKTVSDRSPERCFTHAWFVNYSRADHEALRERVRRAVIAGRSRMETEQIRCLCGDSNQDIYGIMAAIPRDSFVFVFADMEAPKQCQWSTIAALRTHRNHSSVDLYLLFPLEMALARLISRRPETVEESAPVLNAFYGDERWRELLKYRKYDSAANFQAIRLGALTLYMSRLREHWKYVDVVADIRRGTHHRMYKMIFASNHEAGKRIARWAQERSPDQGRLQLP